MTKRILCMLLVLCLIPAVFAGCGKKEAVAPTDTEPKETVTEEPTEAVGSYMDTDERPIAVMIDNDGKDSWPHFGLEDAYLVYEMYVEGSSTRLMALFKGADTAKIGPVRSCRHYFLDYALENDAIYVAYGWSPRGQSDSNSMGVDYINGIVGNVGTETFWRERKYKGDYHSAFTSIEKITEGAQKRNYRTTTDERFATYNSDIKPLESGDAADHFTIPYAGHYKVTYQYDAAQHYYTRTMNSTLHESADGVPYAPVNVIIMKVKNYGLGDADNPARQQLDTVGSGEGYYITEGKKIDITWEKESRTAKTVYKDAAGNPLTLNPGMTFVNIINPATDIRFE